MILSAHIQSIDLGVSDQNLSHLELFVSAQPSKSISQPPPVKVDYHSLLGFNRDYRFELNTKQINEGIPITLKLAIYQKKFIGSDHICEVEFDFTQIPKNQTFRSWVGMITFHQKTQPQLDISITLSQLNQQTPPPSGPTPRLNLETYVVKGGLAANGTVLGVNRQNGTRQSSQTCLMSELE